MVNITTIVQENEVFSVHGNVELFPQKGGWHFVRVPKKYTEITHDLSERGLVPITATLGNTTWKTSLLPMGDGTHFIALSVKVRKAEKVKLGDSITMSFVLREP